MPKIIENREDYAYVLTEDNDTEMIPWSPRNRLIYKHGLHDLLVARSEILQLETDGGVGVELSPRGENGAFDIRVEHHEYTETVPVPEHEVPRLTERLADIYEGEADATALIEFGSDLLDYDVNPEAVRPLASVEPLASAVEVQPEGWLIHDHVLLTYDNSFHHPSRDHSYRATSSGVNQTSANVAYEVSFSRRPDTKGQANLEAFAGLGNTDETLDFVTRALWAVTYTPEELDG